MPHPIEDSEVPLLERNQSLDGFDDEKTLDEYDAEASIQTLVNSETSEPSPIMEKLVERPTRKHHVAIQLALSFLRTLLPSFILPSSRKQHVVDRSKLRPTAYMDGVRGVACFIVLAGHNYAAWIALWIPRIDHGYGSSEEDRYVIQMPIVRVLYSGWFSVAVFFILSGYVLALKPLQLARTNDTSALLDYLASAVFRRAFRLFLPVVAITLITTVLLYNGFYHQSITLPDPLMHAPTFGWQLTEWWDIILQTLRPYQLSTIYSPKFNPHLWTISIEFRGSIIVFLLILALSRVRTWFKLSWLIVFTYYTFSIGQWEYSLFFVGIILAEISCIRKDKRKALFLPIHIQLSKPLMERLRISPRRLRILSAVFWLSVFTLGLFLGSWPQLDAHVSPGFVGLARLVPAVYDVEDMRHRFWNFWGAVAIMVALENWPALQRPFTTTAAQYLGKISFALYIVHLPMGFTAWNWTVGACIAVFDGLGGVFGCVVGNVLGTFMTICVADLFWRGVDKKSVDFARWVYAKVLVRPEG